MFASRISRRGRVNDIDVQNVMADSPRLYTNSKLPYRYDITEV